MLDVGHPLVRTPLCEGALILVCALSLAFVLASVEDRFDRLLSRGMVSGDVEQVTGGMGLQGAKFVVGL